MPDASALSSNSVGNATRRHEESADVLSVPSQELGRGLIYLIRHADREINRRFLFEFGNSEAMPPVALSVLVLIGTKPGLHQHEIALDLGMDKANAARLIRKLDKNGWLVRRHPAEDQRRLEVFLTPAGVHELARLKRNVRTFERKLADRFTTEELNTLLSLLTRLC